MRRSEIGEATLSLHMYLKEATAPEHDRVDTAFSRIGFATVDGYRIFLRAQANAVFPVEAALHHYDAELTAAAVGPAWRGDALKRDLAALDVALPEPTQRLYLHTADEAIGAAYVLEGSRLGGKMLSRMIRAQPGMETAPLGFLDFPAAPGFWQSFVDKIDSSVVNPDDWPKVMTGAQRAFQLFAQSATDELEAIDKA